MVPAPMIITLMPIFLLWVLLEDKGSWVSGEAMLGSYLDR